MEKVPLFLTEVEEELALYLFLDEQVELVQVDEGNHRSDEPAVEIIDVSGRSCSKRRDLLSKSIKKADWAGVPTEILPAHSSSLSSSVSFSDWRFSARRSMRASTSAGRVARSLISAP
jgi:hypothetical protein